MIRNSSIKTKSPRILPPLNDKMQHISMDRFIISPMNLSSGNPPTVVPNISPIRNLDKKKTLNENTSPSLIQEEILDRNTLLVNMRSYKIYQLNNFMQF